MINAIIVDNELRSRKLLQLLIKEHCPNITILDMANSAKQALELINKLNPDLVFLDIEMPNGSGFDLLESIENPSFAVIFVTAYDKYAIKAFKFSAIDYLLKPIDEDELVRAINKIEKQKVENTLPDIEAAKNNYNSLRNDNGKLALSTQNGTCFYRNKRIGTL